MGSNRFTILIALQIILLSATIFCFWWSLGQSHLKVAKFLFAIFWLIEITVLIRFVNRTNHSLSIFLDSLRASDFINELDSGKSAQKLQLSYNKITEIVKKARLEKESNYVYLHTALEHMPVGVLSFDKDGNVEIFNTSAQQLLSKPIIENINQLNDLSEGIVKKLENLKSGESIILNLTHSQQRKKILFRCLDFKLHDKNIRLVSLQNIKKELEVEELNAWHKIIRVMTHEIMNSVGPIKSLSNTLLKMMKRIAANNSVSQHESQAIQDIIDGLSSIKDRSHGMGSFVKSFKDFSRVPQPNKEAFSLREELQKIEMLMREKLDTNNIKFSWQISPDNLIIHADRNQFFQITTNLINNSIFALAHRDTRTIRFEARKNLQSQIEIKFWDNGKGIPEENLEKIFIPFYTTRQGGSGIGLSLIKQIMHLHGGNINVYSKDGAYTQFVLLF